MKVYFKSLDSQLKDKWLKFCYSVAIDLTYAEKCFHQGYVDLYHKDRYEQISESYLRLMLGLRIFKPEGEFGFFYNDNKIECEYGYLGYVDENAKHNKYLQVNEFCHSKVYWKNFIPVSKSLDHLDKLDKPEATILKEGIFQKEYM